MTENTNILRNTTDSRLTVLETLDIARRFSCNTSAIMGVLDQIFARIENRAIEYLLISRMKKALRTSSNVQAAEALVTKMRGAYNDGSMETLPSFQPFKPGPPGGAIDVENNSSPHSSTSNSEPIVMYIPGGGFIMPPSARQKNMIQRFAKSTGCETIIAPHRLAPEYPFPAALHDIVARFLLLLDDGTPPGNIFLAADTAGASIGLGAIQLLQQAGHPLPAGIILFSPWCDLSLSGWSYVTSSMTSQSPFRMETASFCARLYLQEGSGSDPLASPIFANVSGWPPILIHTSRNDLHFDDAIRLAENGQKQGCDVKINYWESPRHHLERLSSADAAQSFQEASSFIRKNWQNA